MGIIKRMIDYPDSINDPWSDREERLAALRSWQQTTKGKGPGSSGEINNHIHTIYSFSPYTPAMAALRARDAGLGAAGSVDHDSIAAAGEMLGACAILGIGGCVGFEVRVSFKTGADGRPGPFAGRKINNPDSEGFAYMTVQGIPGPAIPAAAEFLKPIREERLKRTRAMAVSANAALREAGFSEIDFQQDIYARSQYAGGGRSPNGTSLRRLRKKLLANAEKGGNLRRPSDRNWGWMFRPKSMPCFQIRITPITFLIFWEF